MKPVPNPVTKIILVRTVQISLAALVMHWVFRWPLTGAHAMGLFLTPLLCLYFVFVFVAPWSWGLPILTRLPTRSRVVALTFDDGPSPETTPLILDILRDAGVPATFFVLGEGAEQHPDLLRRIVSEGHTLGLHGYLHCPLVLASASELKREVARTASAVERACPGVPPPVLFRPPHGFKTLPMGWLLRRWGYRLALWSLNPRDYRGQTAEQTAAVFHSALHPGAIALLHDGAASINTVHALPAILDGLKRSNYHCVRLGDDGLAKKGVGPEADTSAGDVCRRSV